MILCNRISDFMQQLFSALYNHENFVLDLPFPLPEIYRLDVIHDVATCYQFLIKQNITQFQSHFFGRSGDIENRKLNHSCRYQTHVTQPACLLYYYCFEIVSCLFGFSQNRSLLLLMIIYMICLLTLLFFYDIILSMFSKTLRRHFQELSDLSPWVNEERQKNSMSIQPQQKQRIKKMKSIPPRAKSITLKKHTERNTIKVTDYELPPLNKRTERIKQHHSLTIQPPQGRLIRNISSHKISHQQELSTDLSGRELRKFRLSGKKYDMLPQQKCNKWATQQTRPQQNYMSNNTMLIFAKSKDDILKRVLNQIQGRIKQINIYE